MATSLKLRSDIKKYEAAIKSKATPEKFKDKLKVQLGKAKSQLESMKSSKAKKPSAPKKKSALDKLKARYKGSGVDIKKDSERPALPLGRRTSKSGNTYYENRLNRADVRQPPKRYPKLEAGGMMAKGGEVEKPMSYYKYETPKVQIYWKGKPQPLGRFKSAEEAYEVVKKQSLMYNDMRDYEIHTPDKVFKFADGGMMAKGGKVGTYTNRIVNAEIGEVMVGKISGYRGSGEPVYDVHEFGSLRKDLRKKVGELSNSKIKELLKSKADGGMMAKGGMVSLSKYYKTLPSKQDLVGLRVYDENNDEFVYIKSVEDGIFAGKNANDEYGHYYDMSVLSIKNGGGYMAKGGISSSTTYVPNRDVKELSVILSDKLKSLKGSDIVDGVYVKKSALKSLKDRMESKKSSKSTTSVDSVYDAIISKSKDLGGLDEDDKDAIKKEDIKKLINAGYDTDDIKIIYLGAYSLLEPSIDNEISRISGLLSYRYEVIPNKISLLVKIAKEKRFEMGLKYPNFNWSDIVKKYKISKDGKEISGVSREYGNTKENYVYTIYEGDKVVLGTSTNRITYKNGVKEPEDDYYKRDASDLAKFQGGYWGVVSSSKDVIKDLARMILSKKAGYVKDMDLFINSLGGVDGEDLDENDIKYADGGMMADGGYMADGGKTKKWSDIKKGKIEDLKSEIEYLDKYLKNLENENTKESYEASNKLRNYKATLQAKILNLEDEEYAKGGYMAKGGKILSAINRDRAYKSQESWEQNYVRKNRPKNPKYKSSSNIFEEGGMMAKGGALEHGLMVGDLILMTKTGYGQDTIGVRNQNDGINYLVDLGTGERKNLTIMSHGGELHRTQE
jgi:hypothetical protein